MITIKIHKNCDVCGTELVYQCLQGLQAVETLQGEKCHITPVMLKPFAIGVQSGRKMTRRHVDLCGQCQQHANEGHVITRLGYLRYAFDDGFKPERK